MLKKAKNFPMLIGEMAEAANTILKASFNAFAQQQVKELMTIKQLLPKAKNPQALQKRKDHILNSWTNHCVMSIQNGAEEVKNTWQAIAVHNGIDDDVPDIRCTDLTEYHGYSSASYLIEQNVIVLNPYMLATMHKWDDGVMTGLIAHELVHWHQELREPGVALFEINRKRSLTPNQQRHQYTHSAIERQAKLPQVIYELNDEFQGSSYNDFLTFLSESPTFLTIKDTAHPEELKMIARSLYKYYT